MLLRTGLRAGRILFSDPTTKGVVCSGVFINSAAVLASFPMLRIVVLPLIVMVGSRTIFQAADFTSGFLGAGSGSAAVRSLVQHCIASRADMPVIVAVIAPCCRRSMACCFFYNRIFIRDLGRAVFIREPLFTGGADPVCLVAIFRAGCVLCRNSGQRVADCDLRRSNDGSNIFKIREGCTLLEKFTENRNVLLLCVTFQNFKRQCKQYAFARRYIRPFFCTSRSRSYRTTICFAVVFNRIGVNNHKHVFNIRNFIFFIANGDFIFRIDGY